MESKSRNISKEKTFCAAPWMHLHVINDGRAFPCCVTEINDNNVVGNVKDDSLLDILNSPKMNAMRKGMLESKNLPKSCERCTGREASGFSSMRQGMNDQWYSKVDDLVENTNSNGSIDEVRLLYWDIRFSNYCNLACRTCHPIFSTSWANDYVRLRSHDDNIELGLQNLDNETNFWKELDENLSKAEEIHFAGGEPVLMPEHWKIIEFLEKTKRFDVKLKYSTNATKLIVKGKNILDVWEKFTNVHLSLSIDGTGDHFELTRHKGNWEKTKQNLIDIGKSNIRYWVHPTVSILNILHITDLHKELYDLNLIPNKIRDCELEVDSTTGRIHGYDEQDYFIIRFHINPCIHPDIYSVHNIPEDIKAIATKKITEYAKECEAKYNIPTSGWDSLVDLMNSQKCDMKVFNKFVETTKKLDKIRNQDFCSIQPEFKKYFNLI